MSGPIDEEFTLRHVPQHGTLLEMGCSPGHFTVKMATANPDLAITGIDLYPPEAIYGYEFVQGDVLNYTPPKAFDVICCVSSFEHCGIETANFLPGKRPDLNAHLRVALKLEKLLRAGGRLIVTCPFGPDEIWYTREGQEDVRLDAIELRTAPDVRWGYRTFSVEHLTNIFSGLNPVVVQACERVGADYFDRASWAPIDPVFAVGRYDTPKRRAVLGVVFEKGASR